MTLGRNGSCAGPCGGLARAIEQIAGPQQEQELVARKGRVAGLGCLRDSLGMAEERAKRDGQFGHEIVALDDPAGVEGGRCVR